MIEYTIIAATDAGRGIGVDGDLPWHLPGDLTYFKETTVGSGEKQNVVIMGRSTWESIPARFQPLTGRLNVVLTRQPNYALPDGVLCANSLEAALALAAESDVGEIFVIGGGQIYREAIEQPNCTRLLLTEVDATFPCDTFFPPVGSEYTVTHRSDPKVEAGVSYTFAEYRRNEDSN
ncbi:MAG: hypothetical protein CMH54_06290 [Myxococcales bacterium]|nr:hypothetical protein [Myxococcales bacterium]